MTQPVTKAAIQWHSADPFPQEDERTTRLHPFFTYLREGRLTTTRCTMCGYRPWPPRVLCPHCWSDDLEWIDLPPGGTVVGFSVQETGTPPMFEKPLIFAVVDVDGVRIFSCIVECAPDGLEIGGRVEFTTIEVPAAPDTEQPRILHAFKPT